MSIFNRLRSLVSFKRAAATMQLGVLITDQQLFAVKTVLSKGHWLIDDTLCLPLSDGIEQTIAIAANQLDAKNALVHVVLSAEYYQWLQIDRPELQANEIKSALPWLIKEQLSDAADSMVIDYIDSAVKVPMQKDKINVVTAEKATVLSIVNGCKAQHWQLDSITVEEFAILALQPSQPQNTLLIYQRTGRDVQFVVTRDEQLLMTRKGFGFKQLHLLNAEQCVELMDSLAIEIQRSIDYFEAQLKQAPIKKVAVQLSYPDLSNVLAPLAKPFDIPFSALQPELAVEVVSNSDYWPCLGALATVLRGANENHH